jgi:hypothetical protein
MPKAIAACRPYPRPSGEMCIKPTLSSRAEPDERNAVRRSRGTLRLKAEHKQDTFPRLRYAYILAGLRISRK